MDVLITGTSQGIGLACARLFLERGHRVWGIDIQPATIEHEHYQHFLANVAEKNQLPANLEPELIVNNAGVQGSADDIAVNLVGTMNVTEAYAFVGEGLAATPAPRIHSVVNVGSASGHTGSEFPAYAASKGGILAYTKNVANRLARRPSATASTPAACSPSSTAASWTTSACGAASWTSRRCAAGPRPPRLPSGSTSWASRTGS